MDFAEIDARRAAAGIDQKALCERAGVNQSTYSQIKQGHRGGYVRTLQKLDGALKELTGEESNGSV